MENVPSKLSAPWVIIFARVKFWSEHKGIFLLQMANTLSSMLYQAVRVRIILGWVTWVTQAM